MQKLYEENSVSAIADAIRTKGGSGTYTVGDMAQAVLDLPSGGSIAHFLEPKEMIGTMTVDENQTLALGTALASVPSNTLVVGFCPTAATRKILLLYKRANNNVSISTGFSTGGYGETSWNNWTYKNTAFGVGDTYYLFTGNNF